MGLFFSEMALPYYPLVPRNYLDLAQSTNRILSEAQHTSVQYSYISISTNPDNMLVFFGERCQLSASPIHVGQLSLT